MELYNVLIFIHLVSLVDRKLTLGQEPSAWSFARYADKVINRPNQAPVYVLQMRIFLIMVFSTLLTMYTVRLMMYCSLLVDFVVVLFVLESYTVLRDTGSTLVLRAEIDNWST